MSEPKLNEVTVAQVGTVWMSNDKRSTYEHRYKSRFEVVELLPHGAVCKGVETGKRHTILLRRFKANATGYVQVTT